MPNIGKDMEQPKLSHIVSESVKLHKLFGLKNLAVFCTNKYAYSKAQPLHS